MKNNNRYPQGLTLIELLVVVIIIMLVMSIGTNTYRNQRRHVIYENSVLKVANLIKTARNYAVTSRSVYDECVPGGEIYVPPEGYGVYISHSATAGESRVVLFANTEIDDEVEANQYDNLGVGCANDLIEETFTIPVDVEFVGMTIDKTQTIGGGTDDEAVIIFRPPLADATIAVNDHPAVGSLTFLNDLYLQFRRPGTTAPVPTRYIYFNKISGFPEVEIE